MSPPDDSDTEQCSICSRLLPDTGSETWTTPDGASIDIPTSDEAYCIVYDETRELIICEPCYQQRAAEIATFDPLIQREIHYEFALEYRDIGRHFDTLVSLAKSFVFGVTPKSISEFAGALADMEKSTDALSLAEIATAQGLSNSNLRENIKTWRQRVGQ